MVKKNRLFFLCLILACLTLAMIGCRPRTAPVYNVSSAVPATGKVTAQSVSKAIIRAGAITGWQIVPSGKNELTGTLHVRTHTAVVTIPYTDKDYQIVYKNSVDLDYDGNTIHENYNSWVRRLDDNIRREMVGLIK